ncbi:unnamed protein product [Paramecium sonneborni]|uniref:Uncharacterized protein n=1 Tax=Paramecium sonneborni TaxID=65129 RepID=A0A8S1NDS9_9CILI|nr:unnamed protein product [Paramecium sonneborni]CAD8087697.1 unnamed protein product [Paramecium sonneborni]
MDTHVIQHLSRKCLYKCINKMYQFNDQGLCSYHKEYHLQKKDLINFDNKNIKL